MTILELKPTNGRKSFGHKANVYIDGDVVTLYSYNTEIAQYNQATKEYKLIYSNKITNTTAAHLKSFKQTFNIS
jgi:hypothetical protein